MRRSSESVAPIRLVDELHLGWYGGVAVEGMALGRPVVCFINETDNPYGSSLPIERADPATIKDVLAALAGDRARRAALAAEGRAFALAERNPRAIVAITRGSSRSRGALRLDSRGVCSGMPVGLFDTPTPLAPLREGMLERITDVVDGGQFILGPEVAAFEREFAAYLGARHAIGVANGTDAITIALRAMGVARGRGCRPILHLLRLRRGDPPAGATPVFCDIDPTPATSPPETVRAALTPGTTAMIAVHLFGLLAPGAEMAALGVPVLEDAAQAAGASCDAAGGSLGTAATFTFFPQEPRRFSDGARSRPPTRRRRAGADAALSRLPRQACAFDHIGYNSRLDELQAAILRV